MSALEKDPAPGSESHHRSEGFPLILNEERIRLQDAFDGLGDFMLRQTVNAVEHLDHSTMVTRPMNPGRSCVS